MKKANDRVTGTDFMDKKFTHLRAEVELRHRLMLLLHTWKVKILRTTRDEAFFLVRPVTSKQI